MSTPPDTSTTQSPATTVRPSTVEPPPTTVKLPPISDTASSEVIPPSPVSASHDFTRLPKLNIPTFAGDVLQWQSFWDCFEAAVHHNRSITGVQKLNYLRAQLQGAALRAIAGLSLTHDNYTHSVALLQE